MRDRAKVLTEGLEAARARAFDWQSHNCGLMAADIAKGYAGIDYAAPFRSECRSALSAMRMLKRMGGFEGLMSSLGFERITPPMARRGDAVLLKWESKGKLREAMGIAIDWRAVFPGIKSMETIPLAKCAAAWRVEDAPVKEGIE